MSVAKTSPWIDDGASFVKDIDPSCRRFFLNRDIHGTWELSVLTHDGWRMAFFATKADAQSWLDGQTDPLFAMSTYGVLI